MQLSPVANMAADLYVRALSRAYQSGTRVYDPDYAHVQDPEAYEKIRRDPEIAHAMQYRRHLIAGRDWAVIPQTDQPADTKASKIVDSCLKELMRFASVRFNLSDAVFRGSTFGKIIGKRVTRNFGDGKPRHWWVPKRIVDMDRWRFRQVPLPAKEQSGDIKTRWEYWDTEGTGAWHPLTAQQRRQLVVHTYFDSESTLGYGRGLLEALYYFYWCKTQVLREGLQGIERWAQGWIVAEIEDMRRGSADRTNDQVQEEWMNALEKMRSRFIFTHEQGDKIDVKETSGKGHEMVMSMIHYLDQAMTRLILAGLMPTGGGTNRDYGSLARAREESESTEMLVQYDRDILSEDINRDLVALVWRLNRANFHDLGLEQAMMPKFSIRHVTRPDPAKAIEVIMNAVTTGMPLRRDEAYEQIGFSPPNPEDQVITAPATGDATIQGRNPATGRFMPSVGDSGKQDDKSEDDNPNEEPSSERSGKSQERVLLYNAAVAEGKMTSQSSAQFHMHLPENLVRLNIPEGLMQVRPHFNVAMPEPKVVVNSTPAPQVAITNVVPEAPPAPIYNNFTAAVPTPIVHNHITVPQPKVEVHNHIPDFKISKTVTLKKPDGTVIEGTVK